MVNSIFSFSHNVFLAHLSTEYSVSYCDHSLFVVVCPSNVWPSVHNLLVNTLASWHNIYTHKVSDEFNYGTNQTRTSGVICP